jgi:cytochrome c-type biogenesis protein CcmH
VRTWLTAIVFALALVPTASIGAAENEGAEPAGWAYDLSDELMSPFCPGRTLSECPSEHAQSLRMWLIAQEAAGRAQEDVEEELLERYGDILLPAPRAEGVGITAYLLPVLVFLGGGVLVAVFLRRQTAGTRAAGPAAASAGAAPSAPPRDPELERIVDEEIRR